MALIQISNQSSKTHGEKSTIRFTQSICPDCNMILDAEVFEKETGYRYHIGGYHKENGKECIILLNPDQPNPSASLESGDQVLSDDYNDIRNPDSFKEDLDKIGSVNINDLKKGTYILVPISEFDKNYTYKRKK